MTKMKWNYMENMIMSVLGVVCHLILYFPVNQGLAINLQWLSRKNKQRFELFEVFLTSSADQCFFLFFFAIAHSTLKEYEIIVLIYYLKTCSLDLLYFYTPKDMIL